MLIDIKNLIFDLITKLKVNDGTVSLDQKVLIIFGLLMMLIGICLMAFGLLYGIVGFTVIAIR